MSFYRKKPVVIEAMQWDGSLDKYELIHMHWPNLRDNGINRNIANKTVRNWSISTLEGRHLVSVGDYRVKTHLHVLLSVKCFTSAYRVRAASALLWVIAKFKK